MDYDFLNELRRQSEEFGKDIKREMRRSKHGLLKVIALELLPVAAGAALGGIGRLTGCPEVRWFPVGTSLMWDAQSFGSIRGLWGWAKYAAGAALPYADKIYAALQ